MRAPTAKDRTRTEHVALVRRVKWASPEGDYVILELADGLTAKGPAAPAAFAAGTQYRFLGRWKQNDRWGDEFHFSSFTIHALVARAGAVAYLTKLCEGIGERTADRLWAKYGADCVRVLREEPDTVVADNLLRPDVARAAAEDLEREKHLEATRIDLHDLLVGRGFHGKLLLQAICKWGAKAPAVIRRDPFKLLGLAGAGYKRCDKLWRELGLPMDRLKRQLYAALHEISNDRDGHTWLAAMRAAECVVSAVGADGAKPKQALKLGIRAGKLRARKDAAGAIWVALTPRAEAERRIADGIRRLCSPGVLMCRACGGCGFSRSGTGYDAVCDYCGGRGKELADLEILWPDSIPVSRVDGDGLPSQHQADQFRAATLAPVGILVGGPGTGKSHSVAFALRQLVAEHGRDSLAVCAPTGKAAVRMTQAMQLAGLDLRATTIHQLLEIGRNGHDGGGWGFCRNPDNHLDQDFVVVDETSMVDTALMADLLDACGPGTHVLFVGDPHQLPPVGHGAPLRDLIAAGVPTGELTEVRRNAGRIVFACRDIKAGRPVEFSPRTDLDALPPENLRHVECPAGETADVVVRLLAQGIKGFHPVWQTQVIVALNDKGACSRADLNQRLQKLLNPDGAAHPKCRFRVADKIICLRNTWLRPCEPVRPDPLDAELRGPGRASDQATDAGCYRDLPAGTEVYCANGEIGRVVAVGEKSCVCRFGEAELLVRVGMTQGQPEDSDDRTGRAGDFDLGYAVTGHKMQGSQAPCVLIVADDGATAVAAREWWYTSLSRASKLCVVVGPRGTFDKQAAKVTLVRRKTFLVETIQEARSQEAPTCPP